MSRSSAFGVPVAMREPGSAAVAYAAWSFGSRQRLNAAAVIRNCHPTLRRPLSLLLRIPPVCFIHPNAFSISGLLRWLTS